MLPETHPLIAAATKPLADNAEQHLAARAMLEENFDPESPAIPETLARLERMDSKKRPRLWRTCIHVIAAFAFLVLSLPSGKARDALAEIKNLTSISSVDAPKLALSPELTPSQQLLIGDPALPEIRQKELLHLSEPERPDFYIEYTGKFISLNKALPPGYLETSTLIDPENSFPFYNAAAVEYGDSITKVKPAKEAPPRYKDGIKLRNLLVEKVWQTNDELKFEKAIALITKAGTLPRYETYETSLATSRLPFFNQDQMIPRIQTLGYFAGQTTQIISIRKIADLISAKAYFLSLDGDEKGFLEFYETSEKFLAHLARTPDSNLISELVYTVNAASTATAFHSGAKRLGLRDLAEKMRLRKTAFEEGNDRRKLRKDAMGAHLENEGSLLLSLTGPAVAKQVDHPPEFDPSVLTPGRLAEHEFYSAVITPVLVLLLGLASLTIYVTCRQIPPAARILSKRFDLLLNKTDWVWIFSGTIVTLLSVLLLTRHTSLGGRDFSIRYFLLLFPLIHFLLIFLLLLTVPTAIIRWRLGKRLSPFRLAPHIRPRSYIIPFLGTAALLFAHPLLEKFSLTQGTLAAIFIFPALWTIAIMMRFASPCFGKASKRLFSATVLAALPVTLSLAIILLATLVPYLHASAAKWVFRDHFSRVVPNALNPYEAQIAAQKRKETNAILGFE